MRNKIYKYALALPFLLSLLLLISCDDGVFAPAEKKMVGKWRFDKVTCPQGLFGRQDITHEYSGLTVEFYDDETVVYRDEFLGENFIGPWVIQRDTFTDCYDDDCDTETIKSLRATVREQKTGAYLDLYWDDLCVFQNKITYETHTQRGLINFRMKRIY